MSKSVIMNKIDSTEVTGKVTEGISLRNNSSILSQAGKKSLMDSFSKDISENPYFPHKVSSKPESNNNKMTGRRGYNCDNIEKVEIPSLEHSYVAKWN